jgi:hypothetical protein
MFILLAYLSNLISALSSFPAHYVIRREVAYVTDRTCPACYVIRSKWAYVMNRTCPACYVIGREGAYVTDRTCPVRYVIWLTQVAECFYI